MNSFIHFFVLGFEKMESYYVRISILKNNGLTKRALTAPTYFNFSFCLSESDSDKWPKNDANLLLNQIFLTISHTRSMRDKEFHPQIMVHFRYLSYSIQSYQKCILKYKRKA